MNNHLIVTIPDFIRNFSFNEFWINRKQFIRDMHPDKMFYWDDSMKDAFFNIKNWIEHEENLDSSLRDCGLSALSILLNGDLDLSKVSITKGNNINVSSDIIILEPGQNIDFPGFKGRKSSNSRLNLRKLEIHGKSSSPAKLSISGSFVRNLSVGEVAYITELDGYCIEILPNYFRNNSFELNLISQDGAYYSTLLVQDLKSGIKKMIDGVVSFALVQSGYIYIDKNFKPIYMASEVPKFMLKHNDEALYVKAKKDAVLILYKDGTLRSTVDISPQSNIIFSDFDSNGKLINR